MASVPDCTLVTACYVFTSYHAKSRNVEETLQTMDALLAIPCYLVIYCNQELEQPLLQQRSTMLHLTKIIVQPFESLWCHSLLNTVKKNRESFWPTRDERTCAETHLITCNKADFVLQTIHSNPFQTRRFGWIDANLGRNGSKISRSYTNNLLLRILDQVDDRFHLQLLNVVDKKYKQPENKREYYLHYRWVACGCLFTTSSELGIRILSRIKELIVSTTEMGYGHGEEMFYLEILDEFYDDIHRSYGDYQDILHNFIEPTTSFVYIYWNLVMRYYDMGYHKECIDVCKELLKQFDKYVVELNYDLYVRLYSVYYLSLCITDAKEAERVGDELRQHIRTNPYIAQQFHNLRSLCRMNHFLVH